MKEKTIDLTEGRVLSKLIKFALPILLTFVLQQLYSTADAVIVGRFVGAEALAAVGSSGPVISFLVQLFIGFSGGGGVVVSQLIGAKDKENLEKAVHTSICLGLIGGAIICVIGLLMTDKMIEIMNTPKEIVPLSRAYLGIYFCGMIPSLLYNFASGIIRAAGDSKGPLKILTVSGFVNVVLNIVFVVAFKWGVVGVAVATVVSQITSAVLVLRMLIKTEDDIKLTISKIRIHKNVFSKIMKIGIPSSVTGTAASFSNAVVQSTINSFGTAAVAGFAACNQLENYVHSFMGVLPMALLTFIGQNYGAGNMERCRKGVKITIFAQIVFGLIVVAIPVFYLAEYLIGFFVTDAESVRAGVVMIRIVAIGITVWGVMNALSNTLLGYGEPIYPMIVNIVGNTGFRLMWIYFVLPFSRSLEMLYIALPVSWTISMLVLLGRYMYNRKNL